MSAVPYGDGVALVYRSLAAEPADDYSYTIADVLARTTRSIKSQRCSYARCANRFVKRFDRRCCPCPTSADSGTDWKDEGSTRVEYQGTTRYAVRAAYKDYRLFALYPKSGGHVWQDCICRCRRAGVPGVLGRRCCWCALLPTVATWPKRTSSSASSMPSVLRMSRPFLLYLDTLEIEGINMSPSMAKIFAEHTEVHMTFLDTVCRDVVSPGKPRSGHGTYRYKYASGPYGGRAALGCRGARLPRCLVFAAGCSAASR